ncbi:MAG: NAD(P)/FAD-dependent oxidoreductase [Chloroflexi bacterium]|nr:NAD(P)/FAD-dependent oxidoreductase [Chloroflexota bacterium]
MTCRRTAVLGAGALGLTVAYRLVQAGDAVTVIEREPEAGGLAAGFEVAKRPDGTPVFLEKFYHHLFRADHAATSLIDELGLGDKLVWPTPVSTILRDGGIHRLDGIIPLLKFQPLPFVDRLRMGAVLAYLKAEKGYQRLEGQTAEAWLTRWMGKNAYQVFAEPLLRQKFGEYSDKIAMPWFWSRVHLRSTSLGYLLGGFQQMYDTLAHRIRSMGGTVSLGTTVTSIDPRADGTISIAANGESGVYDRVVSTLPARITIGLTSNMPEAFSRKYGQGTALGAHCLVLELDRQMTDAYWIAVNDPGYPFLAVVEHTNYIPPSEYGGKHLMYVGNYLPMKDPLYSRSKEELVAQFLPYLQRINPAMSESWIKEVHSFAAPFAQPVVTKDFKAEMAPHVTPIPNLFMANMFQVYPQDRGQNYSIAMAERLVRRLEREAHS